MPNEYKQVGNQRIQLTDEEQAALDASRVKSQEQLEAEARAAQLEALRQPVVVEGVTFPVLRADMGFYAAVWVSRDNPETSYPLPLIGLDGVITANASADVDRVYRAINQAIADRASQS